MDLSNAKGVLACVTSSEDISLFDFALLGDSIDQIVSDSANVIIGTAIRKDWIDKVNVTIVVTGLDMPLVSCNNIFN